MRTPTGSPPPRTSRPRLPRGAAAALRMRLPTDDLPRRLVVRLRRADVHLNRLCGELVMAAAETEGRPPAWWAAVGTRMPSERFACGCRIDHVGTVLRMLFQTAALIERPDLARPAASPAAPVAA